MNGMIMLDAADGSEEGVFAVSFSITVFIGEYIDVRAAGYDHFVTQYGDTQGCIDIRSLIKYGLFVGYAIPGGIFEDDDTVTFFAVGILRVDLVAVIKPLADPDTAPGIDVHIG